MLPTGCIWLINICLANLATDTCVQPAEVKHAGHLGTAVLSSARVAHKDVTQCFTSALLLPFIRQAKGFAVDQHVDITMSMCHVGPHSRYWAVHFSTRCTSQSRLWLGLATSAQDKACAFQCVLHMRIPVQRSCSCPCTDVHTTSCTVFW